MYHQSASSQHSVNFQNKYCIYSTETKTDDPFWADFFYVNKSDTIIKVESVFGYRIPAMIAPDVNNGETKYSKEMIAINSNYPYLINIQDRTVYYKYMIKDTSSPDKNEYIVVNIKQYSLKKGDTCFVDSKDRKYSWLVQNSITIFTGIDTSIKFNDSFIHCYKFIEYNINKPSKLPMIVYENYLDKKTFIPVKVNKRILFNDGRSIKKSYLLRFLLDINDVQTTEYYLPQ